MKPFVIAFALSLAIAAGQPASAQQTPPPPPPAAAQQAPPPADPNAWLLDKSHSSVEFAVTHMVVAEATGRFKEFDLKFIAPGDDYTKATLEATIQVASINTDNDYRDNDLRGPEFFDAAKFPTAVFKSTSWEKAGENKWKINGDLTIRDVTKPVTLDATFLGSITGARGTRAGWKAVTTIDRFVFGTTWDKKLDNGGSVVSKDVLLTIRLELRKPAPEQQGSAPAPEKK